ncbi:hypothetical protein Hypma_002073 [Hypsizygus marmoreus]|uniref:Uncharacterized protein n=1 Tax=Hypsizygus marmoreus TaxID=39966 RepID=A0A369K0A2_HYPMA|nr:hypothetical protein Hypma_002073 [Hypsizygus marmoreus]
MCSYLLGDYLLLSFSTPSQQRFWPRGERMSTSVLIASWGVRGAVRSTTAVPFQSLTTRKSDEVPASMASGCTRFLCGAYIHFDINSNEILAPAASAMLVYIIFDVNANQVLAPAGSGNACFLSGNPRERPSSLSAPWYLGDHFDVIVNQVLPPAGSGNTLLLPGNPRERLVSLSVLWCRSRSFRCQIKPDPAPRGERKHSLQVRKPPGLAPRERELSFLCRSVRERPLSLWAISSCPAVVYSRGACFLAYGPAPLERKPSFLSRTLRERPLSLSAISRPASITLSTPDDVRNAARMLPITSVHSVIFDTCEDEILAAAASGNTSVCQEAQHTKPSTQRMQPNIQVFSE